MFAKLPKKLNQQLRQLSQIGWVNVFYFQSFMMASGMYYMLCIQRMFTEHMLICFMRVTQYKKWIAGNSIRFGYFINSTIIANMTITVNIELYRNLYTIYIYIHTNDRMKWYWNALGFLTLHMMALFLSLFDNFLYFIIYFFSICCFNFFYLKIMFTFTVSLRCCRVLEHVVMLCEWVKEAA